ncbi:uncharacterized protein [Anabrus simplex]|uniref:uncharacterized protein n=1 Tax=Anabrus simplex TaxID=316456 RepID=UPI0035A29B2F
MGSSIPCTSTVVASGPAEEWTAFSLSNLKMPLHPALKVQPHTEVEESSDKVTPPITPSSHSHKKNVPTRKQTKRLKSSHNSLLQAKLDLVSLQARIFKQQNRRHLAEHRMRMKLLRLKYMAAKKRQM